MSNLLIVMLLVMY